MNMKPVILADKEAMFGLSFSLAVTEALMAKETVTHTRRYRKLEKVHGACLEALECYPGEITAEYLELATGVFETMQAQAMGGLFDEAV